MKKITVNDNGDNFEALLLQTEQPFRTVLFAVGSGGNPERHLPLLTSLAAQGATVVAPYFERLVSGRPTEADLQVRARRLRASLNSVFDPNLPVMGVGHSIGATLLIALAGGQLWLGPGQRVLIPVDQRYDRLVLMAPPTAFFQAPDALSEFHTPFQAWVGANDDITPPDQVKFLNKTLGDQVMMDIRIDADAGHFTFMNTPPPQKMDPHPDREDFLNRLASEINQYLAQHGPIGTSGKM